MSVPLKVIEDIIDASGIAPVIEDMLPAGVRGRQLSARILLIGMHLTLADDRPAHLTRVLQALITLPGADQRRPGVVTAWQDGPHQLTCRQVEHTFWLVRNALGKTEPDGAPSRQLQHACDALLEASIPHRVRQASSSLAADWTDVEAWARPVAHNAASTGADPEAAWGHRNVNLKIARGEMFFGYYLSRNPPYPVAGGNGDLVGVPGFPAHGNTLITCHRCHEDIHAGRVTRPYPK